jgi:GAF domain-containing protein/HAMP domain-containing protein
MQNSLRFRLIIILIILAIGPLLLAGSLIAQRSFTFERQQAYNLQDQVAQNISTEIRSVFLGINNDLNALGNEIRSLENPDQAQQLSLLLRTISSGNYNDFYDELTLLNQNGQEIVRLSPQEIVANTDLVSRTDQDVFTQPASSRSTYYSLPALDPDTGKAFIMIAIPLYLPRSTTLNSVLVARIKIEALSNILGDTRAGENQTVYLTDASGNVLAHQDRTLDLRGKQIQLPTTTTTQTGLAGDNVIMATDRILLGSQTLQLVAEKPVSVALEIANTIMITIAIVILLALVIAGLVGYFAVRQIVVPIEDLASLAGRIAKGDLSQKSPIQRRDEIGVLAKAFNSMTSQLLDLIGSLERRVNERTADLNTARLLSERRAQDLQAISEISRAISTEQRLEILLPLITRLVSERFGFYHVGIFSLDGTHRYAYLQAANSEGGQRMLARGHRLEIGKGLVGTVAQTGKARIALDVGSDAVFFDNPDLPDTRSEMALPLNLRGQTIGVVDVQNTKSGAFSESDANTLGILADQVAIAIDNARLFGQTLQAREEAEALSAQIQHREWNTFVEKEARVGYRQTATGGRRLAKPVDSDEIRAALENGRVVVVDRDTRSQPTIAVPVQLRGQTIGVLNIKAPAKSHKWGQEEVNLVQAISDRLALALDNARLLLESQRRAAKEAKIAEVSARIGASINMRNVLQTAVEELGRALPGSEVVIQFENSDGEQAK